VQNKGKPLCIYFISSLPLYQRDNNHADTHNRQTEQSLETTAGTAPRLREQNNHRGAVRINTAEKVAKNGYQKVLFVPEKVGEIKDFTPGEIE